MAADPVIAEFQAQNTKTIKDSDGDYSDWIEIRNPATESVNLDGWYLTDDINDLRKWQFPAVSLPAGQELLVFASNKNRRDPAAELHSNFRLTSEGEYLALVKPDGVTVVHAYAPTYPAQLADESYGLSVERNVSKYVTETSTVRAIVPTDNSLGATWTQSTFDDRAWPLSGSQAVGFEELADAFTLSESFDQPLPANWTTDVPAGSQATVKVENGLLKMTAPRDHDAGDLRGRAPIVYRSLPDGAESWEVVTQVDRTLNRGNVGIGIFDSDTGRSVLQHEYSTLSRFRTMLGTKQVATVSSLSQSAYSLRLAYDGVTQIYTSYFKLLPTDEWTLVATIKPTDATYPSAVSPQVALYVRTTTTPIEADFASFAINVPKQQPVYGPTLGVNTKAAMYQKSSSLYTRYAFNIDQSPANLDELVLRVAADDGFRAYLNGNEVTSRNVPVDATWNSSASSEQGAVAGKIPVERIDITAALSSLRVGQNVLAIHGMNVANDDRDFYLSATLEGADVLSTTEQFFSTPTPRAANLAPAATRPQIVGEQGTFFGTKSVELTLGANPVPSFEIHYTLDGTDPTLASPKYTGPIELTTSALLQARTFDVSAQPKFETSPATAGTFFVLAEDLRNRSSDLPLVILDTLGQGIPGSSSTTLRRVGVAFYERDEITGRSALNEGIVNYLGRGGIRDRGSSTSGQTKPNLAFETWGANGVSSDDDEDVALVGLAADSDWVLHAPYDFDRALVRNQFAYALGNEMGHWAPKTQPVEVYLNRRGVVDEADYQGVYVLIERIKPAPERLDIPKLSPEDNKEPEVSGGYIWKFDRTDPDAPAVTMGGQSFNWVYPKSPQSTTARPDQKVTAEQEAWLKNYFTAFQRTLTKPDISDPEGYSKYIDVDSWVDNHLLNVFMDNVDAFVLSAYFFKNRGKKIEMGPLWDFDRSAESTDDRDDTPLKWGGSGNSDFFQRVWWGQVFRDAGFWQRYVDRWHMFRQTTFSNANINSLLDKLTGEVAESQERNFNKWRGVRSRFGTWEGEVEHLREWLLARAAFFDANFAPAVNVTAGSVELPPLATGAVVQAGEAITLSPEKVKVPHDRVLLSGDAGAVEGTYFIPVNDDLGNTWTQRGFDDSSWGKGPMGMGFGTTSGFADVVKTQVQPSSVSAEATTFMTRIKFQIDDPTNVGDLILRMKYDDGYEAYINGTPVASKGLAEIAKWNTRAIARLSSKVLTYEDVDISKYANALVAGTNVLSIRVVNTTATNNDMLIAAELVGRTYTFEPRKTGKIYYTVDGTDPRGRDGKPTTSAKELPTGQSITITQNTRMIARNFDTADRGSESNIVLTDWSAPAQYNFVIGQSPLIISEVNYHPAEPTATELAALPGITADDFSFVEIHNPSNQPASLVGPILTQGVDFDFMRSNPSALAANGYAVVVKNVAAFQLRYGNAVNVLGTFTGTLARGGENVQLEDGTGQYLSSVDYQDNDPWPVRADGLGASLELIDPSSSVKLRPDRSYRWRASSVAGGTPGAANSTPVGIVINEVLANAKAPDRDAIELYNTTTQAIDLSGWYLSDAGNDLRKYRIPAGTQLGAGQYLVIDESQFNAQGDPRGFGLNADGDNVWLVSVDGNGAVSRFVDDVHFEGTRSGESLGRVPNGTGRLAPETAISLRAANAPPRIGPVILSEVKYARTQPTASALAAYPLIDDGDLTYVEVHNTSSSSVSLKNWRIRGGVDYDFGDVTVGPQGVLLVVPFNPDAPSNAALVQAFRANYGLSDQVKLVGGFAGQLSLYEDRIELQRAEAAPANDPNAIPHVLEDEVVYDSIAPWPAASLVSMTRRGASAYGNDPTSWTAANPSPGVVNFGGTGRGDFDGNGIVSETDIDLLFEQLRISPADPRFDLTGDGRVTNADRDELIHNVLGTTFGDTNLDKSFTSDDLIRIFQAGKYEDATPRNGSWAAGDFNGDGDVTTSDLVLAFQDGTIANLQGAEAASTSFESADASDVLSVAACDLAWSELAPRKKR